MIDKWLAPTPAMSIHVTVNNRPRLPYGQYACVEVSRPAADPLAMFFFRHEDGSWQVFPPVAKRAAMRVSH
jgi:hypothetical protein